MLIAGSEIDGSWRRGVEGEDGLGVETEGVSALADLASSATEDTL